MMIQPMKTVAMVLFPDFLLLDMAGPMEVFSIANRYLKPADHYVLTTIGTEPGALRASNGVRCRPTSLSTRPVTALICCWCPAAPVPTTKNIRPCSTGCSQRQSIRNLWLDLHRAFVLGHAGLLDGFRVTTHWHYTERLIKASQGHRRD
jgi:transcriptional regulator GlxA family with amidase domain